MERDLEILLRVTEKEFQIWTSVANALSVSIDKLIRDRMNAVCFTTIEDAKNLLDMLRDYESVNNR
jgi:hypothetical protein